MLNKDIDRMSTEELGKLFPVILVAHNPEWKDLYLKEEERIVQILKKKIVRIDHIGSTAVPGLISKPTIDILLQVVEDIEIKLLIKNLENIGYHCIEKPENPPPHIMMVKGYTINGFRGQAYHLHIRYRRKWDEITFRDHLIENPKDATAYAELKLKLASKYRNNRELYTEAKSDFIIKINELYM
jgi:GrpB-like predicted nucleotidyltransferase (UPF0157 family)